MGLLDHLPAIYREVWIPESVYAEYQVGRARHPGSPDLDALPWFRVHAVAVHLDVPAGLDAGEVAALSLALRSSAELILLDEQRARRAAVRLGLPIAGSLTVLIEAKQQGLIPLVELVVDQMIAQGRRINASLRTHVLQLAGE